MLNRYVWKLYLESGGNKVVEMFRRNLEDNLTNEYADEIVRMHKVYCPMSAVSEEIGNQLRDLVEFHESLEETTEEDEPISAEEGLEDVYKMIEEHFEKPVDIFDEFSFALPYYSTNLAIIFPDSYVPYYYRLNYNVLQKIADSFEIELPEIPPKKNYKDRFYHYGDVCRTLTEFRKKNGLSLYELCAFLYDFAPNYVGGMDSYIIKDLPEPHSAYFIGAAEGDSHLLKEKDTVTSWQCSPDTRAGDMIVMYVRTPVSAINSIWRACSIGFVDPFFFYYRCVYISSPVSINPIPLTIIKKDKVFKELPIVRKNMQGINGVELRPSVYNYLVKKSKAKVKSLEYIETKSNGDYTCEKDVETKLITPLIQKLGYGEKDYKQQMYVEIGNHNNTLIPDYVILPNERRGFASGFAIIEAKRSIPNKEKLDDVMVQARSYAKLLTAKYCVVASQEKLWVAESKDGFDNIVMEATWEQLNDSDVFYNLSKILGK